MLSGLVDLLMVARILVWRRFRVMFGGPNDI